MKTLPCNSSSGSWWAFAGFLMLPTFGFTAEVILGQLDREYTGAPIVPSVTTIPEETPVTLLYRKLASPAPVAASEIVFKNTPAEPPLSYISMNFSGNKIVGLGNYLRLEKEARKLESCEVQLVTWARPEQYPGWAAINPERYFHPVTLSLYSLSPDSRLTLLTDQTRTIFIPWRPELLPDGSPYPFNGYAVPAKFDFPEGIILPEQVMVVVDYNTESSGFNPIGAPGPYNVLNLAISGLVPSVGMDLNEDDVLAIYEEGWFYPDPGWKGRTGPLLKMTASNTVSKTPPIEPGSYEVTAIAGAGGTEGTSKGTLTISEPNPSLTFPVWQRREFTQEEIGAGDGAWDADPDEDGINNQAEFATGTNPHNPIDFPAMELDPAGWAITLVHPKAVTGIRYLAEQSTDLTSWSLIPVSVISTGDTTETIRAKASRGAVQSGRTYLRFRFER